MSTIAIVQARMGSSRFYGKVLKEVCGKAVIEHIINRLKHGKRIDKIVLATSSTENDNVIADFCSDKGIPFFRGSENDVLDRFYQAAKHSGAVEGDSIVRITGDCPLIDPVIVDEVIKVFEEKGSDYCSNVIPPTFPDGLDVEVFKFETLEKAWKEAKLMSEREHVTTYIYKNPDKFKLDNLANEIDYSGLRWTVDTENDFKFVKQVYEKMGKDREIFHMRDVLELLEKEPELKEINCESKRNEGYEKSLKEDKLV